MCGFFVVVVFGGLRVFWCLFVCLFFGDGCGKSR